MGGRSWRSSVEGAQTRQDGRKGFLASPRSLYKTIKKTDALNETGVSRRYIMDRRCEFCHFLCDGTLPFRNSDDLLSGNAGLVEGVGLFIV